MKDYLDELIFQTTDSVLEADAVEYGLIFGWLTLTYDLATDKAAVLSAKAAIVASFQRVADENMAIHPMMELV